MEQKQLRQVVNITPSREICPSPKSTFETWWICKRAKKSCCACLRDRLCDIPRFQKPFPPGATADEIDPEGLMSPVWGTRWTLPEANEILICPKSDEFCFIVFPGNNLVGTDATLQSARWHPSIRFLPSLCAVPGRGSNHKPLQAVSPDAQSGATGFNTRTGEKRSSQAPRQAATCFSEP